MTYEWAEHTAEIELRIEAPDELGVFRDALAALAELLDDEGGGRPERHAVALDASGRAELLAAWLEELVYLADAESFVPERAEDLVLEDGGLRAVVAGRHGAPRPLVKGVPYHDLEYGRAGAGWRARLVLDV